MKRKKKSNVFIVIIIVILIIILLGGISIKININIQDKQLPDEEIIRIANKKFGYNYCEYNGDSLHGAQLWEKSAYYVITEYHCDICGNTKKWESSNVPLICPECCAITHRCKICGGLIE